MTTREIDTGTDDLLVRIEDGVAVFTMNRPERRNAMSSEMVAALGSGLAEAEIDDDVRCVMLTGAGGGFCAGGDVKGMAAAGGEGGDSVLQYDARVHRQRVDQRAICGRLYEMPKPTVAALPGPAAGAGLSMALACDLRYAVEGAKLTTAFAKVGFAGDYGGTFFLSRLIGAAKAKELYYFSDVIDAKEGERLGIVNAVFSEATFEPEVMELAKRLAAGADRRLSVHEGEPQPGRARRDGGVPRYGGGPPHSHRPNRRPQRSGPSLRRQANAGVQRKVSRLITPRRADERLRGRRG